MTTEMAEWDDFLYVYKCLATIEGSERNCEEYKILIFDIAVLSERVLSKCTCYVQLGRGMLHRCRSKIGPIDSIFIMSPLIYYY